MVSLGDLEKILETRSKGLDIQLWLSVETLMCELLGSWIKLKSCKWARVILEKVDHKEDIMQGEGSHT